MGFVSGGDALAVILEALKTADTENYKNRWLPGPRPRRATTAIVARRWVGGQKLTNEFPLWYSTASSSFFSSVTFSTRELEEPSGASSEPEGPNETIRKRSSYWPLVAGGTNRLENAFRKEKNDRCTSERSSLLFLFFFSLSLSSNIKNTHEPSNIRSNFTSSSLKRSYIFNSSSVTGFTWYISTIEISLKKIKLYRKLYVKVKKKKKNIWLISIRFSRGFHFLRLEEVKLEKRNASLIDKIIQTW